MKPQPTTFLQEVAADLYGRYGRALADRAVLFPSRRARLFFIEALGRIVHEPVWQPAWTTIDELMEEISGLATTDRVRLIAELYKIYSEYHDEPFDKFYFWGELLLADFDTIDKYRIDADQLFQNITDIKEIEADISYLTPRQIQLLSFWSTLGPETDLTEEKRRFLAIWRTLGPIYHRFRDRLRTLGIAYNGMVQRTAADRLDRGEFAFTEPRSFVVAGFNALSECEKRLFKFLQTAAHTDFYWDCDDYYVQHEEQEAGLFVRENLELFPPRSELTHDGLSRPKQLTATATVSNAVQCKYVAEILRALAAQTPGGRLDKETAVVLTDEQLLLPLLHALPPEIGGVNVTMGFPLKATLAYTFVERLIELQAHGRTRGAGYAFYHADVTGLLAHPYVAGCDGELTHRLAAEITAERRISVDAAFLGQNELLRRIFTPAATWRELTDWLAQVVAVTARTGDDTDRWRTEYLAVVAEELAKMRNTLETCGIELTTEICTSLLRRHLQTVRIPFEGEPLEGIQVMGILETRNLDFRNVIVLSMTDDNFPGNRLAQPTFIPYNLRAAFALPTPEHHEGVYAYYFYRLIQRAERVHMLYCSHADEKSTGEPSRYIRQLDYESGIPVQRVEVGVDVNLTGSEPISVAKSPEIMRRLERFTDPDHPATLSPTAFYRYVACPLRFYFHSVARLKAEEEVSEEVDAPMFGTILHAAAQRLYDRIRGEEHPAGTLRALIRTHEVAAAVEASINENYLCEERATADDYTGNLLLVKEIVIRYLRAVMAYDAAHDRFAVAGLEERVAYTFPFRSAGRELGMKFAGIADRIDRCDDGSLRVVDYKTGAPHLDFAGLESLFRGAGKQRLSNIIQTLLYAMMLCHTRGCDATPALYYVRAMHRDDYSPQLIDRETKAQGAPYSACAEPFEELVRETLAELYDPEVPFRQCDDEETCRFCDFNILCKR